MLIIERILDVLEKKHLKMVDLTRYLHLSTSTTSNWKTKLRNPPADLIVPICEFLDVSTDYLLTGTDKSTSSNDLDVDQEELLSIYSELDNEGKSIVKTTCYTERRRMNSSDDQKQRRA